MQMINLPFDGVSFAVGNLRSRSISGARGIGIAGGLMWMSMMSGSLGSATVNAVSSCNAA